MRLWTFHPKYLDRQGLLALWREALLAQKVLLGETKGYRTHPQLARFQAQPRPAAALAAYLEPVWQEAYDRGYHFDAAKIGDERAYDLISVSTGQLLFEQEHLKRKLQQRDPERYLAFAKVSQVEVHPLFRVVAGGIESWEKGKI